MKSLHENRSTLRIKMIFNWKSKSKPKFKRAHKYSQSIFFHFHHHHHTSESKASLQIKHIVKEKLFKNEKKEQINSTHYTLILSLTKIRKQNFQLTQGENFQINLFSLLIDNEMNNIFSSSLYTHIIPVHIP